ncbi:MAG: branched-chain amino acid ABC transporter permease [Thermoplasmata archaeon]
MSFHTGLLPELLFFVSFAGVFMVLSLGLNLQWGYTGLFNIGVAAFWAVGAYTSAILTTPYREPSIIAGHLGFNQPFIVGFFGAILVSAFLGFLIALPSVRLRADYLAIATLGLAEIIRIFLVQMRDITGGTEGIRNIPKPIRLGVLETQAAFVGVVIAVIIVIYFLMEFGSRSPWGRVLKAIREDEEAALALGKNTFGYKVQAFTLGAAIMGAAGSLYAHFLTFIEPLTSFRPFETFVIWGMVIMGGSGNNKGVLLGAVLLWGFQFLTVRVETPLTRLPGVGTWLADNIQFLRLMTIGFLLVLLVLYRPQGILGEERVISKMR